MVFYDGYVEFISTNVLSREHINFCSNTQVLQKIIQSLFITTVITGMFKKVLAFLNSQLVNFLKLLQLSHSQLAKKLD